MWSSFPSDTSSHREMVAKALDLAASRLATSFGSGWHLLPHEGDIVASTRVGDATISRDSLRSAARGIYTSLVKPGTIEELCTQSLAEAESLVQEGGSVALTPERLERFGFICSYLSPGRVCRDDMVEAGRTLRGLHSNPVRESFLTNAAWEAHGCLMACLGGSLPHRYFFFLLEADFSDTPMNVTAEQAVVLRNDCLDLPAYGQEIEATLRIIETGLPR